jgi:hypothetical protein
LQFQFARMGSYFKQHRLQTGWPAVAGHDSEG